MRAFAAAVFSVLLGAAPPAGAQQSRSVHESAEVSLVEVPVRVLSRDGNPVRGLTAADFTVEDDGHRQEIVGFDAIEAGNAAMGAQNWSAARESYLKAVAELPDNAPLLERIAATYLADGKTDDALRYAHQAADKDPSDAGAWKMVAELELQKGNLEAGRAALDKVPVDKITDPQPYFNIGVLLVNKKQWTEAMAAFDRAIAIKADDASAYYYRGLCHMQLKQNAEAKADLRKALDLEPNGSDAKDIQDLLKSLS